MVAVVARVMARSAVSPWAPCSVLAVCELHVVADVVDGQGDGAVSADARHGDVAGVGGAGDGPTFTVSHWLADAGAELPVVAPRDDDVTDHRPVSVNTGSRGRVEFAAVEAVLLDSGVDRGDVFVAGRHDRQRLACVATPSPGLRDRVEMILKAACARFGRGPRTCRSRWGHRRGGAEWWWLPKR